MTNLNPTSGNAPGLTSISRRNLFCAAPVVLFAGAGEASGDTTFAEQVLYHVAEIERLLQDAAPENVTLRSVSWHAGRGDFWASGHWIGEGYGNYRLAHFRPQFRPEWWVQEPARIFG